MKIMFLQGLTGGLLNGLLKPRLNRLFTRTPVLAVLLLTAVVAACGSPTTPGNQAPVFTADNSPGVQFTPANGTTTPASYSLTAIPFNPPANDLVGNVSAIDPDGDTISYNISGGDDDTALFQINSETGEITLRTTAFNSGNYVFNVTASDGKGGSTTATISVTAGDPTPPEFIGAPYNFDLSLSMANDGAVVGNVSAMDDDGTPFNYRLEGSDDLFEDLFELATADNADDNRGIILRRAATLSDFAVSSITFQVVAAHQFGGTSSEPAAITVNLNNDLQLGDDSDGDGVNDFYDASPHDDTTNVTGNGEPDDPYIISNIYQLQAIAGVDHQEAGLAFSGFTGSSFLYGTNASDQLTKHYMLANDINASATADDIWTKEGPEGSSVRQGWIPIAGSDGQSFSGSFSGEGYAINSLTSMLRQDATSKNFGLFGINNGNITALGLQNINIGIEAPGDQYIESTTIDTIISGSHFGGLVGLNQEYGIISYSYTTGSVNASMDATGGLVGVNEGEISYSYSTIIYVGGEGDTGGLVGANEGGALLSSYAYVGSNVETGLGIVGRNGTAGGLAGSISGEGAIINSSYAYIANFVDRNPSDVFSRGAVVAERDDDRNGNSNVTIELTYFRRLDPNIPAVGKQRADVTQSGDTTGTTELTNPQFLRCGLDGLVIGGVDPALDCSIFFPSSHWGNNTKDGVTRGWIFNANQYPSLSAVRSSDDKQLLPLPADQNCHRNNMSFGCE